MSVTSLRSVQIVYTGDVTGTELLGPVTNTTSPGQFQVVNLTTGANTITCPATPNLAEAVTIDPPSGNTVTLTLKGVTGDTGVNLHLTNPTTIALATGVTTFVITTSGNLVGLRLYWS